MVLFENALNLMLNKLKKCIICLQIVLLLLLNEVWSGKLYAVLLGSMLFTTLNREQVEVY